MKCGWRQGGGEVETSDQESDIGGLVDAVASPNETRPEANIKFHQHISSHNAAAEETDED